MPRTRRSLVAAALVLGLAAALAGCDAEPAEPPSAPPTSPAPPIFASDEEALAAAEDAYAAYAAVDAEISAKGGADRAGLSEVVGPPFLEELNSDYDEMARLGYRATGAVELRSIRLVEYVATADPEIIRAYACIGVGETRIFDSRGTDVTPDDRKADVAVILEFGASEDQVRLVRSEAWDGDTFCQ
ncbi:hypothetical protein [Agromyces sp. NPDC060279]|uniref:hypothetical protein n=1 Tax=Agromyces sp. NPDC060279 TaxID=3347092 RepID=UPI0036660D7A